LATLDGAGHPRLMDPSDLSGTRGVAIESFPNVRMEEVGAKTARGEVQSVRRARSGSA